MVAPIRQVSSPSTAGWRVKSRQLILKRRFLRSAQPQDGKHVIENFREIKLDLVRIELTGS